MSKNSEAIINGSWLVIATVLIFYFFDTKTAIDSLAQDYPSFGLSLISKWAPLLFPLPRAFYLLWDSFPQRRKALSIIFTIIVLPIAYALVNIIFYTGEISSEISMGVLAKYFSYIGIGSILVCDRPKKLIGGFIDWIMGWGHEA
jgi:hypothetical protein